MTTKEIAFIEASNCFDFANQIWASRQKEKYEQASRAYEMAIKIFIEHFSEKNTCAEEEFEF